MNSALLRRLIFTFLTLSLLAGSVSLLWPQGTPVEPMGGAGQAKDNLSTQGPAFVENLPIDSDSTNAPLPSLEPGNLTDVLAKNLADKILSENPSGPQLDLMGSVSAKTPDIQTLVESLVSDPQIISLLPTSSISQAAIEKKFKILKEYENRDLSDYIESLSSLADQYASDPKFAELPTDASLSVEAVNATDLALAQTIKKLEGMPVPQPLLPLHLRAWQMFTGAKDVLSLSGGGDDPAKNYLILEQRLADASTALAGFQSEFQKINLVRPASGAEAVGQKLSFLDSILGVQEAHAQLASVPITVFMETAPTAVGRTIAAKATWVQKLLEWGRKLATEMLKERLIKKLVSQTIQWVQGGGKPLFVTNWKSFLRDAGNVAVGDALYKITPGLCQPFQPLIRIAFSPVNLPMEKPVMCTLDQVVRNVQDFYSDFGNGGWIAYGASLRPENNFWGSFIQTSDILAREKVIAKEAAENEALAGQGFTRTRTCAKEETRWPDGVGPPYKTCVEWKTTTPGSVVSHVVSDSLAAPILRIVNAQDLEALVNAFVGSALNKLFSAGTRGLLSPDVATESTSTSPGEEGPDCTASPAWQACQAPNQAGLVERVKAYVISQGIDLSNTCGAFEIVKRVAWALQDTGAGVLATFHSSRCAATGMSGDLIAYPDGSVVDILGSVGEANTPQWLPSPGPIRESGVYYVAPSDPGDPPGSY